MRAVAEPITYRAGAGTATGTVDADPIMTEVIRHGLNSAANQMKRALIRTAFSPVIYEVLDFAVAIYDRDVRLLAQAPSLPLFMGTMNFCIEAAVEAVGGEEALEPGDIILYNYPYGTGSHPQDAAVVMPIFLRDEELIGYSTIKGHWLDIGGKEPYSTDTVDVFQEGTIFPGVKLYSRGERVDDIYRMALANSRVPKMVAGDINAEVVGVRTATAAVLRLVEKYGLETFKTSVERMFDHGEQVVRAYFEKLPDGRYVGQGQMDNNGLDDNPVPFEVAVEVDGSTVRVDFTNSPDAHPGPINCPIASTVSASRIAITMLAGSGESPNEGHFRPIEVVARPGLDVPSRRAVAVLPLRLAGDAVHGSHLRRRCEGDADRRLRLQRRGHLCARLVGRPRGDGRALGGRFAAPRRPGGLGAPRRSEQPAAPRRGGDALLADRGVGVEESLAAGEGRTGARLGRRRLASRRPRGRPLLPGPRGLLRHGRRRAH